MGTPGVKWNVSKAAIVKAIKKHKGKITYAARELDCDYTTIKKRINADPELIALIDEERNSFSELLLDSAEDTLLYGISNRQKDLGKALSSAFFVLNNKGKQRGYTGNSETGSPETFKNFCIAMEQINKMQKDKS